MKKTLIALLALSGVVMGETCTITFSTGGELAGSYSYGVDWSDYSIDAHAETSASCTSSSGVIVTLEPKGKNPTLYTTYSTYENPGAPTSYWTNQSAIDEMNTTLGTSITLAQVDSAPLGMSGGHQDDCSVLTFDFSRAYSGEDSCVIYLLAGTRDGEACTLSISGLNAGYTVGYASAKGNGYDATAITQTARVLTLVKVTGTLTNEKLVTITGSNESNNGYGMVAYTIPEPTTATLSLLALAGLAARRRRK